MRVKINALSRENVLLITYILHEKCYKHLNFGFNNTLLLLF